MSEKREKIVKAINDVFIEQFELESSELAPEKEIFADLGLDSLDIVDLMVGLQGKFDVSLRQREEIRQVKTMGDVYDFFEKLLDDNPELAEKFLAKMN